MTSFPVSIMLNISAAVAPILTEFGMQLRFIVFKGVNRKNPPFSTRMAGGSILLNCPNCNNSTAY
jgi:hypothetical protein